MVTGRGLLELWGGSTGIKGGRTALGPICSGNRLWGGILVMQTVGER